MARRSSALSIAVVSLLALVALQQAFVAAPGSAPVQRNSVSTVDTAAAVAAASSIAVVPEAAQARLPDDYQIFAPLVDFLPLLPLFFFLLAFLWQAMVGFR
eukprot:CAMPEP_0178402320 /NCGR_PEP_ID=MMETSP0689_2-20121128/16777_1 /TAXON_ID=160604 /ORGANISM="Amphidinium massartii, Strain CS-259" /LENGTH=100 /DNA_ID=CAMNT_0020023209 /DNA_START=49 /DNA_END=351 /DNA_ORIENTATION=-